jgi:hypothetical protein
VLAKDWVRRVSGTRALVVTPRGAKGFRDTFGVDLTEPRSRNP